LQTSSSWSELSKTLNKKGFSLFVIFVFKLIKMNVQAEKIKLAKTILNTDSEIILQQVKAVLNSYKTDLWDEIPDEIKESVNKARKQLKTGEGKPHKEVMKKYKKWLTK
jgi:deoxyribodipyrimidine photolyase